MSEGKVGTRLERIRGYNRAMLKMIDRYGPMESKQYMMQQQIKMFCKLIAQEVGE